MNKSMSEQTYYRKYRSQTFEEIAGQAHVVTALKNAIKFNRMTHAYIFSGPRGTGKTSIARIFAKSINCPHSQEAISCENCQICHHITAGNSVDIIEIDAASNTGVDNIRSLNETINYSPVECQYKFYIIDEAHMLSTGAFNALLKTLEEPPEQTIFILATTEHHKIPVTIHSRCQHFHFRTLSVDEIISQLNHVAKSEQLNIDAESLDYIARHSEGCMRDALSLLNQAFAYCGQIITQESLLSLLGTVDQNTLIKLMHHIANLKIPETLTMLHTFSQNGASSSQILSDLMQLSTTLLYISLGVNHSDTRAETPNSELNQLAENTSPEIWAKISAMLANIESEMRWFSHPSLLLEIRIIAFITQHSTSQSDIKPTRLPSHPTATTPPPSQPKPISSNKTIETSKKPKHTSNKSGSDEEKWAQFLSLLKTEKSSLYLILQNSKVAHSDSQFIHIQLKQVFDFFISKLSETHNLDFINHHLSQLFAPPKQFKIYESFPTAQKTSSVETDSRNQIQPSPSASSTLINDVVKLFDGQIV
jgi:DNA polymerase-3 subunit gamma/tau